MFLIEIKQTGVLQLLHQIRDSFQSEDILQKENAARYLAFLMTYRDIDYVQKDANPLPIEYFLRPGVETSIQALKQFADSVFEDKAIDKRVLRYTKKFLEPEDGERYFNYQLTKLQDYFKKRNEESKLSVDSQT